MMIEEEEWMRIRSEALEFARKRETKLIEDWCAECKVTTPVGYYFDIFRKVVKIYSVQVGSLIGAKGVKVDKFKAAVEKEFGKPYEVEFVEIRGGFANVGVKE